LGAAFAALPLSLAGGSAASDVEVLGRHPQQIAAFLESQDEHHRGTFYAVCNGPSNATGSPVERALFAVELSRSDGQLFVWYRAKDPIVANAATIRLEGGRFEIIDPMGGQGSEERLARIAEEMRTKAFHFVADHRALPARELDATVSKCHF